MIPVLRTYTIAEKKSRFEYFGFRPPPGLRAYSFPASRGSVGINGSTIAQNASEISQVLMRAIQASVLLGFKRILACGWKIASNLFIDKHLFFLEQPGLRLESWARAVSIRGRQRSSRDGFQSLPLHSQVNQRHPIAVVIDSLFDVERLETKLRVKK